MSLTLKLSLVAVTLVLALGGVVFAFGTPQAPDVTGQPVASGVEASTLEVLPADQPPAMRDVAEDSLAEQGAAQNSPMSDIPVTEGAEVPEPDPSVPLAIEIPGCRCHSDDPKIVEEHSKYRMNQCAGCHAGQTPTGM